MSQPEQLVCDLNDIIKQKTSSKVSSIKQNLTDTIKQINTTIHSKTTEIKGKITETQSSIKNKTSQTISNITQEYHQTPISQWRSHRPDVTLLVEITVFVIILMWLYSIWPYLSASKSFIFSKEQYMKASMLPESAYSIDEMSKIKIELKALKDYFDYFTSPPYSLENQGIFELNKGVIFLPIISFIVIYIVPPFVILYIIWFIITYWKYVLAAVWGWFLMIYHFGSKLVECKLASKWYIRMVTGWSTGCPDFSQYFNAWRRQYIDIPVYYEKLKYIQEYYAAKEKYYTIPKRYYIDLPKERYKVKTDFLQKVYVDRATEVFLKKLVDWYHTYYELPRDELYHYLLRNNKNLGTIWAKTKQTQKQVSGLEYDSTTPSGALCSCPGTQTPVRIISDLVSSDINLATDDFKTAADKVKQLYDDINLSRENKMPHLTTCQLADKVVNNRNSIYFTSIIIIVLFFIVLFGYSAAFGTPSWFYRIIGPTWQFVTVNSKPMLRAKWWDYSIYLIIATIMGIIGFGLYKVRLV